MKREGRESLCYLVATTTIDATPKVTILASVPTVALFIFSIMCAMLGATLERAPRQCDAARSPCAMYEMICLCVSSVSYGISCVR